MRTEHDNLLKGKDVADKIKQSILEKIQKGNHNIQLISVTIGSGSSSNESYLKKQQETAKSLGITLKLITLSETLSQEELENEIKILDQDPNINGIIIQRPLPDYVDAKKLQENISVQKDIEGMNPTTLGNIIFKDPALAPCTAKAALEMLLHIQPNISGMKAVVVGQSPIVGKPLAILLTNHGATVTTCNQKTRDLKAETQQADVIFVAVGKVNLITADMVKEGAIVIDIGINVIEKDGKQVVVGDVDFENVAPKCRAITPVPGGVGPVTATILMENTLTAFFMQQT